MVEKKKILAICGSASLNSANLSILKTIAKLGESLFDLNILDDLSELPHFKTELTDTNIPEKIVQFRNLVANTDGIIICTPEYIFSIPSGLKNALEWCVSTTVFTDKTMGLITASASGEKAHEELQLIMETLQTKFTDETTLLIQGVKGKIDKDGKILDKEMETKLKKFVQCFDELMKNPNTITN